MTTALYRTKQFFDALKARASRLSEADKVLAAQILTRPEERRIFARMHVDDQQHGLAIVRLLQKDGHEDARLFQAALLHDAAKCLGQPILYRVAVVLLKAWSPRLLAKCATPKTAFLSNHEAELAEHPRWQRPFLIHAHHPAIGAAWASQAGCDPVVVWLIAHHQDPVIDPTGEQAELLAIFQWADNLS